MDLKFNSMDIHPEAIIAVISLHALIRHQNHLKIKINPVPAPNINIKSNICFAFVNNKARNNTKNH